MMRHALLLCCFLPCLAYAQVNSKGTFQVGFALSGGGHATRFENSFKVLGVTVKNSSEDGAVTVSTPVDFQLGLSDRFSLGLIVEPGRYIDSAGTNPNAFFLFSLSPRFYVVNREQLALFIHADLGLSALRIGDVRDGTRTFDDSYAGGHFRLGTQFQYYFGKTFGLNAGIKLASHSMKWRDRDPEDPLFEALDYEATLRTTGVQFQLGAQVRF